MSKQIPLILTPHELAAALAGRLRQVRRTVVPQPHESATLQYTVQHPAKGPLVCGFACVDDAGVHMHDITCRCPLGQPGDVIWGREAWAICDLVRMADGEQVSYSVDGPLPKQMVPTRHVAYRADGEDAFNGHWRSPITMPRWASRWARTVAAVRVERVQDMTDDDAIALGVSQCDIPADEDGPLRIGYMYGPDDGVSGLMPTPREAYARHFQKEWEANCWQWVGDLNIEGAGK